MWKLFVMFFLFQLIQAKDKTLVRNIIDSYVIHFILTLSTVISKRILIIIHQFLMILEPG